MKTTRICTYCGRPFVPDGHKQMLCGPKCRHESRSEKQRKKWDPIRRQRMSEQTRKLWLDPSHREFMSKDPAQRQHKTRICKHCGRKFVPIGQELLCGAKCRYESISGKAREQIRQQRLDPAFRLMQSE